MGSTGSEFPQAVLIQTTEDLKSDEGYRQFPYRCTAGKLTIAYGRNLDDKGISKVEAEYLLERDVFEAIQDLHHVFNPALFLSLPGPVQNALINMRFQFGPNRFRAFKNMITAINHKDYQAVIREMQDSKWYRDKFTHSRAQRQIDKVRSVIS